MSTDAPKFADLQASPSLSLTCWAPTQTTCTADCLVTVVTDPRVKGAAWDRFLTTPAPTGFDPAVHPEWETPASPTFGVLRLSPTWLRTMPGSLFLEGVGGVWTWRSRSPVPAAT